MSQIFWLLISSVASFFVAKIFGGSLATARTVTLEALLSVSRSLLRQLTWTMVGTSFFVTGVILSALETAEVWGEMFTATLAVKLGLVVIGAGCMYLGLGRRLNINELEATLNTQATSHPRGVDWNEILQQVLGQLSKPTPEPSTRSGTGQSFVGGELKPTDIDRIVAAVKAANAAESGRRSYEPDLTAH